MLAILLACPLPAQTTFATITGTVTDSTGAVVPNATITATNVATGVQYSTKSNEAGIYTVPQLKEGTYTLKAQAAGFKEFLAQDIGLVARDVRRVDVTLEVGAVETAIEVTAGNTLIETETARIANTKPSIVLNTLPLITRGIWSFLVLAPGVQGQNGSSVVRFAGSRVNQGNWSLDGISFADGVDNTQTGPLANYIESYAEAKIDMANNSAEFSSVGQLTLISKSGSNDLHGTLFDYYATPWFRAADYFTHARGTGILHQPGGTIGGPVVLPRLFDGRNRTFFFYSFETSRGSQRTQNLTPTVPLEAWRRGDFSGLSTPIVNPFTGEPFSNNQIPPEMINPVSQRIQDRFYPLPNYGDTSVFKTRNYREAKTRPYDPSTYWTTRVDHRVSDKGYLYGRFTQHWLWNRPYGSLPTIDRQWQRRANDAAIVSYTHTFSPTVVNEIRWGFALNNNPIKGPINGAQMVQDLGLVGLADGIPKQFTGLLRIGWSGIGLTGISQPNYREVGYRTHTEEVQEHFSWFRGRHNLKFGFNLLRSEYDDYGADSSLFGNLSFGSKFTGHPYADFLLGLPTRATRSFPPIRVDRNRWSFDFYALDDFKLSPKLTLNVGLRYELHFGWRENGDRMSMFDIDSGSIVVPDGALAKVSPIFPQGYVNIVEASSLGLPSRKLVRGDYNNIAPRIGLAYRPWGINTVFRAGVGVFYDVVPFVYALGFGGMPYILQEPSYTNPVSNPQVILPRVFPATSTGGPETVDLPWAQNPDLRTPYTFQYNFTIERQQWDTGFRLSYIGTAGRKAPWVYNYNSPVPDARPYIEKPRPYPSYPDIYYVTNGAGHQYNGLTAEVKRQMVKGLYLQGSWTWARDIHDMDYNWDFDMWVYTSENPFDRRREVAPARDIPTHRFNVNYIYQLPFGRGRPFLSSINRWADLAVGGWELSGIYTAQTGEFLTPFWTGPDPVGIYYTEGDPAEISIRPDILRNPNLPTSQRTIDRWFDPEAFAPPPAGRFGTSAKGTILGPGVNLWAMGIHKDFLLYSDRVRLWWELVTRNTFTHPNWAPPATDVSDPSSAGVIGGIGGSTWGDQTGMRLFRMALRLTW